MATTVRKEISKDNYKFFIGRVEKIGNGQVGFIKDTQKKAVELLGKEIPQNVIDAANNHKAFNIWLGSEVNPIIDSNGYKEEIIVIGDGYDFREVKEYSPSIEKIFATVTTEIKPHIKGKYFMQIDDSWYQQSVRKNFSTLEDAVKIARIMHSELRKVSRHIEATVEARTVDISKYYFRSDDWTKFFEIDNYGNEKVLRRETVDVIAKIDNRTVEEVRNDICRYGDNYGVYKNSAAADVEKLIAEVDAVNAEIAAKLEAEEITAIDDYIVDVDAAAEVEEINAEIAECTIPVTVLTVRESEIKAAVSKYNAIGEHFDSIMDVAVDEGLPNWEREQKKLIRKHYAAECKEKAKFLRDFFAGIGLPKKVLKISVSYDYSDILGTVDYTIEISPKTEKINADQLEKIAEYFESRDTEVEVDGFDFYEFDDVLDEEDAKIEINILSETTPDDTAAIETENVPAAVEEITAEKNSLKAKVAEILNRPHKSVINWKATFDDMKISEILNLQKEFKKYLKLGQIDLAENVFSMLKTLCKNYREQFAA